MQSKLCESILQTSYSQSQSPFERLRAACVVFVISLMTHIFVSSSVGNWEIKFAQRSKQKLGSSLEGSGCMDLQLQLRRRTTEQSFWSRSPTPTPNPRRHNPYSSPLRPQSKRNDSQQPPSRGDDSNNKGDRSSVDWNKAWSSFRKKGKKTLFSQFNPDKYVSWNPTRSNYPLSEEVDPIKRAERSNLMLWTSPRFTLAGAIVIVSLLLVYTLVGLIN